MKQTHLIAVFIFGLFTTAPLVRALQDYTMLVRAERYKEYKNASKMALTLTTPDQTTKVTRLRSTGRLLKATLT